MTEFTIENIIAHSQISDSLELKALAEKIPELNYNPDEFSGLTYKIEDPKIAILILPSGKAVCTGGKNLDDLENAIQRLIDKIESAGFNTNDEIEIAIQNIIMSADIGQELHLSSIAKGLLFENVDYEPKLFPGLVYKIDDEKSIILFSSGKMICTGSNKIEDAEEAINLMKEKLSSIGVL